MSDKQRQTPQTAQTVRCERCEQDKPVGEIRWINLHGSATPAPMGLDVLPTETTSDDEQGVAYCQSCRSELWPG